MDLKEGQTYISFFDDTFSVINITTIGDTTINYTINTIGVDYNMDTTAIEHLLSKRYFIQGFKVLDFFPYENSIVDSIFKRMEDET